MPSTDHALVMHNASVVRYMSDMTKDAPKVAFNTRVAAQVRQMIRELAEADGRSDTNWLEQTVRTLHAEMRRKQQRGKQP